ncbi:hypothetical protein [Paenibacillus eucommiae]|uniref:Uncharacterized protein n=1 Tax=Paenibacillus eucommiae TaxID=1355755 RepID=A0ABS4IS03_9BACL|nr:hypothetical protein [Paenibacillus eucommiae]MBP1990320.1 hypothetical protein [Paenibacillus eucommiae]
MDGTTNKGGTRGGSRGADKGTNKGTDKGTNKGTNKGTYNGSDNGEQSNKEGQGIDRKIKKAPLPHDEAFKKLLQTFFAEFIALFFPELDRLLDHSHTRLLMQEQLVDIVGEEAKHLDLLLETKYTVWMHTYLYILNRSPIRRGFFTNECLFTLVGYSSDIVKSTS